MVKLMDALMVYG